MHLFIIRMIFCSPPGPRKQATECNRECVRVFMAPRVRRGADEQYRRLASAVCLQPGRLACITKPAFAAFSPACLPPGRGRRRRRGRSGRGRARRAMQMSGGDGQLCFPMSLRNSSVPSLNSSLQTLYFPQNTGSQALGELAGWLGELHIQQPLF